MHTDDSFELSGVSSDEGVNMDTQNEKRSSYEFADKHDVRSMFRLGRRRDPEASEKSVELNVARPRLDDKDRRSNRFRLGRRSAYDSFLMNYDDNDDNNDDNDDDSNDEDNDNNSDDNDNNNDDNDSNEDNDSNSYDKRQRQRQQQRRRQRRRQQQRR